MKNQALPNSHFCIKISKALNSPVVDRKHRKPTLQSVIANHVLDMSVNLKFQCVCFEGSIVLLWWF